ncbi:MAG: leucine-rich repeat protein [Clostridiales bacterium]|nr:leucine-rich repeat protein [Candidatus Coliplasma caballi]
MKKIACVLFATLLLFALCAPVFAEEEAVYTVLFTTPLDFAPVVTGEDDSPIVPDPLENIDRENKITTFKLPAGLYKVTVNAILDPQKPTPSKPSAPASNAISIHFRVYDDGTQATPQNYSIDKNGFFKGPFLMEPNREGNLNNQTVYTYKNGVLTFETSKNRQYPGYIDSGKFADMECIQKVVFDGSFSRIGEAAFIGCTGLTTVEFADGTRIDEIEADAFADCTALKTVTLPKGSDPVIHKTAFANTPVASNFSGSVLSEGALWIVIAVAAVAIIAAIGLIIWKKRKKVA